MDIESVLRVPVTYFKYYKGPSTGQTTLDRVLAIIKSNFYKEKVEKIRDYIAKGRKDNADEVKFTLHAVTFCATFEEQRKMQLCNHYNSILVVDIDKLKDENVEIVGKQLDLEPYIFAYWKSPSGIGWKGLTVLDYDDCIEKTNMAILHKVAFGQLSKYLKSEYDIELDSSGSDITRLCFMSWDPNLRIKRDFKTFKVNKINEKEKINSKRVTINYVPTVNIIEWHKVEGKALGYNNNQFRKRYEELYKFLKKRNFSITKNFHDWVCVAFAIANTLHPVIGKKMFLKFCELDGSRHDEVKSERLIYDAYCTENKRATFQTIEDLARQCGFDRDL